MRRARPGWIGVIVLLAFQARAQTPCGDATSCLAEGVRLSQDGQHAASAARFERACAQGDPKGCANLAAQLLRGVGVDADTSRAAQLFEEACEGGLAIPCDELGTLYAQGRGVVQDDGKALALYGRSCDGGHGPGCTHRATMVDGGFGTERSWEEAERWYRQGCEHGDAPACVRLASTWLATRRPETAGEVAPTFARACELGAAEACRMGAMVYDQGELVKRDPRRARDLLAAGCAAGDGESCRLTQ